MRHSAGRLIWIASFPKSGNTWVRLLLSNLLAGAETPQNINEMFLSEGVASARGRLEEITLVDSNLLRKREADRILAAALDAFGQELEADTFVKTHNAYTYLDDGTPMLGRMGRAAIYLIRDPRDVAVSLTHFWGCTQEKAIEVLNDGDAIFPATAQQLAQYVKDWSGHARSWLEQTNVTVSVIRYEDLLENTAEVLRKLVRFLSIQASNAEVERAVRHASFRELSAQEQDKGFREASRTGAPFFREGRSGGWRNALTQCQAERIVEAHREMMTRFGYLLDR